jgi:hypothetical protein
VLGPGLLHDVFHLGLEFALDDGGVGSDAIWLAHEHGEVTDSELLVRLDSLVQSLDHPENRVGIGQLGPLFDHRLSEGLQISLGHLFLTLSLILRGPATQNDEFEQLGSLVLAL